MKRLLAIGLILPLVALAQDDPWADDAWDEPDTGSAWTGFVEAAAGARFDDDPVVGGRETLGELRVRVETQWRPGEATVAFKGDARYDAVDDEFDADIRDLTLSFPVGRNIDVSVGRQVQTWGTGDLVFLNDLFPKDFVSFFAGRDDEYLKAPGNAVRVSRFGDAFNVDLVWTPVFEPDRYLTGERFSFFSPLAGDNVSPVPPLDANEPDESLANGEFALRLFRTIEGREYALYGYRGYFKQPTALTPALEPQFAPLSTWGASIRQPLGRGLINAEFAWYQSRDDRSGTDPLVPNDQLRLLAGYEFEPRPRFSVGLQYYLEWTLDHDELVAASPFPEYEPDEYRHVVTSRLGYRSVRERHNYSLFTFFSPSDRDFYLRPKYGYRHSDRWSVAVGANLFGGSEPQTFFSQLDEASNAYVRLTLYY